MRILLIINVIIIIISFIITVKSDQEKCILNTVFFISQFVFF